MIGESRLLLKKGMLWQGILQKTQKALDNGTLLPIPTEYEFMEDGGVQFIIRILASLKLKDEAKKKEQELFSGSGRPVNPFLPYEEELFVSDISDTHIALLNKFNVMENHLLIVTRCFEDQDTLLTVNDFMALWACMAEYDGIGFYNGGEAAGASQRHKHLQMVPLPLAPKGPAIPIEPLFAGARWSDGIGIIPGLPFLHAIARFPENIMQSHSGAALMTFELYSAMLKQVGIKPPAFNALIPQSAPYCLIITRKWMLVVPRKNEFYNAISINSLGFAGALLVRTKEQKELLRRNGPMSALRSVAIPL
jgi:ATP adenylyltransferase